MYIYMYLSFLPYFLKLGYVDQFGQSRLHCVEIILRNSIRVFQQNDDVKALNFNRKTPWN